MSVESNSNSISSAEFWGKLFDEYNIVAITGTTYLPQGHGRPSKNVLPLPEHAGMMLDTDLKNGKWPYIGSVWQNRPEGPYDKQLFAIGSLVYIWNVDENDPDRPFDTKSFAWYLNYERMETLKELERYGIKPMALVLTDFDCPNTPENLNNIISVLKTDYKLIDWVLLDSGNSYHLILKGLVPPKNVPWHWGKIIKSFIPLAANEDKLYFENIVTSIQKSCNNLVKLEEISYKILKEIRHYDDPASKGRPFIVDLRWIAHSIMDLINFQKTNKESFGYLRISSKIDGKNTPYIIAQNNYLKGLNLFV